MPSEFRIIKSLEWCAGELPAKYCPRESPIFLLNGNEYFFQFVLRNLGETWFYILYLKLKNKLTAEIEPWDMRLKFGFKEEGYFLKRKKFTLYAPGITEVWVVWIVSVEDLQAKLPSDYMDNNWTQFLFCFYDVVESLLKINKEVDDKSVQTQSYIDTNILLEDVSIDFSTLLENGPYYDVEFVCGDEAIKAHKNVLSCRSEVFATMLRTDMVEGKTGQVTIQDVEGTVFKQFLRYLYTGVLPELTVDVALRLYEASDKYAVDKLKKQCTSFLSENLSPENACEALIIADRHYDLYFKQNIMEYMMKVKIPHIGEKWTQFCKENPSLANEVLNLIFKHVYLK